jgi:hypothetical protein
MTTITDMRASIDSIKAELGKGEVVTRGRQTGKTTALLEFVRGNDPGNMIIVTCHENARQFLERRYREMYPGDYRPTFASLHRVNSQDVRGTRRRWATDEVWPRSVVNRVRDYEFAEFVGGVGTPMCMEDFSGVYLTGEDHERPESPKPVFMQVSDKLRKKKP